MNNSACRLQSFRQIKSNIRGSNNYLLVGIDIAKSRHYGFFGTPQGRTLRKHLIFDNTLAGFESVRTAAKEIQSREGLAEVVYAVEPTASYHKPLAEYLINNGDHVVYVSNVAVAKNRSLLDGRWDKNDKKDAANVADLVGQGRCLYYDLPQENLRQLRSLVAYRARLKKEEHALRMRLRNNVLAQFFPELERFFPRAGQSDDLVLSIAQHCLDPKQIGCMDFESFLSLISRRELRLENRRRLHALWETAEVSAGCQVHEAARWEAQTIVTKLREVRGTVADLEKRMEILCQQFPEYVTLRSIPGFGPIVSAMVLAAIGNPFRFDDRKQVLRLAGLDLSAERSGKTSDSAKPVISKQGKAALRYALVQAATVASSLTPDIKSHFTKMLKGRELERGIKLKMRVKLAAKFLVVAWTLMKTGEKFKISCFTG